METARLPIKRLRYKIFGVALIAIVSFFSVSKPVQAAPAPEVLVINERKMVCGKHWSGDEFTEYKLPNDWTVVGPLHQVAASSCPGIHLSEENPYSSCCGSMGLAYLYEENIYGKRIIKMAFHGEPYLQFAKRKVSNFFENLIWRKKYSFL